MRFCLVTLENRRRKGVTPVSSKERITVGDIY